MMHPVEERTVRIVNRMGLHARPASELVKVASRFHASVTVSRDGLAVNGKSIMGVLMLAAEAGAELHLRAEGADAADAVTALEELVLRGFGER